MNMHVWIIMGLTMVTAGGLVHVFIYPYLSGDINAEKRQAALRPMAAKRGAERQADAASRRKQITETLVAITMMLTILTVAMPLIESDTLSRRMKSVATERERIRARASG